MGPRSPLGGRGLFVCAASWHPGTWPLEESCHEAPNDLSPLRVPTNYLTELVPVGVVEPDHVPVLPVPVFGSVFCHASSLHGGNHNPLIHLPYWVIGQVRSWHRFDTVVVTTTQANEQLGERMERPESVTAVLTAEEPADGCRLVVREADGERSIWKVIARDDNAAREWTDVEGDRWFNLGDPDAEPMSLREHIKYADAVYALGEKLAEF